jgi:hypothetical protein
MQCDASQYISVDMSCSFDAVFRHGSYNATDSRLYKHLGNHCSVKLTKYLLVSLLKTLLET